MLINPLGQQPDPDFDIQHVMTIKSWVDEVLEIDEDATVLVTELQCTEPGCAPLETVIALLTAGKRPTLYKIYKPVKEVTLADVIEAVKIGPRSASTGKTTNQPIQLKPRLPINLNN